MKNSKPLTAKVYDTVYSDIINGRITTEDILTESMLIHQLGVSKSPVREALIELCNEGILRSIPRLGYMVVPITPREVRELAEARLALELFLLEKSFTSFTDEVFAELELLIEKHHQEAQEKPTPLDNWQRNMTFHLHLAGLSGNNEMYALLERVLRKLTRATTQYFNAAEYDHPLLKERSSSLRHIELVDACRKGDLAYAKRILEVDIASLR